MSINFENEGTPIAIITNVGANNDDKKTRKQNQCPIVCVSDKKSGVSKPFTELSLQDKEDQQFQLIPNPETERQIHYVTGSSGSGKSYFTRKYCNEFTKIFPKRPIYLFSSIGDDSSIDAIKGLKRIKLKSAEFLEEDFDINDFKDCLVIFDDTDVIPDKKLRNKVNTILGMVLETGRHTNTYCIYTSHLACAGNDTKRVLNEAHSITFFPNTAGGRTLKYLCDSYLGLDKKEIEHIKRLPSRWVTVLKTYPKVVVSEKDLFLLSSINK
jgi:hypothetical protein